MQRRQQQSLDTFLRVRSFLDAHPVPGPLTFGDAGDILDDVILRLREFAGVQVTGVERNRGEARRQQQLLRQLLELHVRPIVAVAQAQVAPDSDIRLPASIRMPRARMSITRTIQAVDGLLETVRPYAAIFTAHGLPADFLAQFSAARNAVVDVLGGRAVHVNAHIAARRNLQVQLRRGRSAIVRIDAVIRAAYVNDEGALAAWRAARRVHLVASRPAGSTDGTGETPTPEAPTAMPKAA